MQVSGNVLVCDSIDDAGISSLKKSGMNVDYKPEISHEELLMSVKNYEVIVVRSRTKITKPIIDAADKVKIIARVGVGLDNIDTKYAESKGIRVINAGEASYERGCGAGNRGYDCIGTEHSKSRLEYEKWQMVEKRTYGN